MTEKLLKETLNPNAHTHTSSVSSMFSASSAASFASLLDEFRFSHFWLNQDFEIPRYELIRDESETILLKIGTLFSSPKAHW